MRTRRGWGAWLASAVCVAIAGCGGDVTVVDAGVDAPPIDARPGCETGLELCGAECVDVGSDHDHCGACGDACTEDELCSAGACVTDCPSGQDACEGACFDTDTAREHCGGCGMACAAGEICSGGACGLTCGGATPTLCGDECVSTDANREHCGACDAACADGEVCSGGTCGLSCGGTTPTLCGTACVDTQADLRHCGGCDVACDAGEVCSEGACVASCGTGLTDCSGSCRDLTSDPAACGACDAACPSGTGGTAFCAASACGLTCAAGLGDCNGDATDGCEITLDSALHCGGCGIACAYANGVGACTAGACELDACAAGFDDCDGDAANGCEVDLGSTVSDCGVCGMACPAGQVCSDSACAATCRVGLTDCTGACRDLANDPGACGACGTVCPSGPNSTPICTASACEIVCTAGYADCNGDPADGCEVALATSTSNCGACGAVCALPNAVEECAASTCQVDSCDAGFDDCNGTRVDGCEAALATDSAHCGACGTVCPGGQRCSMGMCVASCASPLAACGLACVNTANDPANCGGCGMACADLANATDFCAAGSCRLLCDAGYGDCDAAAANGCEVDTRSSDAHCGGCGRSCDTGASCLAGTCAAPPRLLAPMFTANVTSRRPTIQLELTAGTSGARVEMCADRACSMVLTTFDIVGTSGRPAADLPTGIVWWRAYAMSGTTAGSAPSTTWYFNVPPRDYGTTDTYFGQRGDLNGDGFSDVVIGSRSGSTATVSYGSATGVSPAPTLTITITPANVPLTSPQFGDFNGDGYSDLWLSTIDNLRGLVHFGAAAGISATPSQTITPPAGATGGWFGYRASGAGDLNGDGYGDLVITHWNTSPARVIAYYGSPTGLGTPVVIGSNASSGFAYRVAGVGDLNGDRFGDVVIGDPSSGNRVLVYYGSATGLPVTASLTIPAPAGQSNWGYVASANDMDGDGYCDVVVSSNSTGAVHYFRGSATGVSATPDATGALGGGGYVAAGIGDANGDGYGDVIFGDSGATARLLLGGPTGMPPTPNATITGGGRGITATGDVNGDGFADWVGSNGGGQASVWHGQTTIPGTPAAARTWSVAVSGYGYPLN